MNHPSAATSSAYLKFIDIQYKLLEMKMLRKFSEKLKKLPSLVPSFTLKTPLKIKKLSNLAAILAALGISNMQQAQAAAGACTAFQFPKIVGGLSADTYIYQIDVHSDDLAFAGSSCDQPLTTTNYCSPIVGVIIMNEPATQFKWAQAHDINDEYYSVSFSQDGALIVAVTKISGYIMVFDSANGVLKTSRTYSGGSYAQNNFIKSIIISSGTSPKSYLMSKDSSSSGNQVVSFNPLTVSSSLKWAKRTSNSPCHLGIIFGNTESIIYAYSFDQSTLKVTRIDDSATTPSFDWTYGFSGSASKTFINHKTLDSTKGMLVISGSSTNLYFGVIIVPSSTPLSPTKNVYYKSTLDSYNVIGIYIVSQFSIKVLFSLSSTNTYLGTLNLSANSFILQQTLPYMGHGVQTLGVFSNDGSKYYIASKGCNNYPLQTNKIPATQIFQTQTIHQAIIYSSDVTNAAYALSPQTPTSDTLQTIANVLISQSNPYSDYTGFSFTDQASTTVMKILDLSKLNILSWIGQQPYTASAGTQATTSFLFQPGVAKSISISQFTSTNICGSSTPVFTYLGIKNVGTAQYVLATDGIAVDSTTGAIQVSSSLTTGTYTVKVKGNLQNGASTVYTFTLQSNQIPVFNPILSDKAMSLYSTLQYKLPSLLDADSGQTLSISTVSMSYSPSFLTFDTISEIITFAPTQLAEIGTQIISVKVTDGLYSPTYVFSLTVSLNLPPLFSPVALADQTLMLGKTLNYPLPSISDPASTTSASVTVTYTTKVAFVNFNPSSSLDISTILTDFSQVGTFKVGLTLSALQGSQEYFFNVVVTNSPPVFSTPLTDVTLFLGEIKTSKLPTITDAEGHTPKISHSSSLIFISFDNIDTFKFTPTIAADVGSSVITVTISDENLQSSSTFNLKVMSKPVFNDGTTSFADLTIALDSVKSFSVPAFNDMDGDNVEISIAEANGGTPPIWVQLLNSDTLLQGSPPKTAFTDVKTHNLKFLLTTANEVVSFPFSITVTNSAPYFITTPPSTINININSIQTIDLTNKYADNEGHTVTLSKYYTSSGGVKTAITNGIFKSGTSSDIITISPTAISDQGIYTLDFVISDGEPLESTFSTIVTIINDPPVFKNDIPKTFTIPFNQPYEYVLPQYADPEVMPVIITLESIPIQLNDFAIIKPDGKSILFLPTLEYQIQSYNTTIILSDGDKSSQYQLEIIVAKSQQNVQALMPTFARSIANQISLSINKEKEFQLPIQILTDDMQVDHLTTLPPYVTFEFPTYRFAPKLASHLGLATIKGTLTNQYGSIEYKFAILVTNTAPKFKEQLQDQKVQVGIQLSYSLPQAEDNENQPIKIQVIENGKTKLPNFINYNSIMNTFNIEPAINEKVGIYQIDVIIADSFLSTRTYNFKVEVMDEKNFIAYQNQESKSSSKNKQKFNISKTVSIIQKKYQVKIQIGKIQRDGTAILMLEAEKYCSMIIEYLKNETLQFSWIYSKKNQIINHTITSKDTLNKEISVKLIFPDPTLVSNAAVINLNNNNITIDLRHTLSKNT